MPAPDRMLPSLALARDPILNYPTLGRTLDTANLEARVTALEERIQRRDREDEIWRRLNVMGLQRAA